MAPSSLPVAPVSAEELGALARSACTLLAVNEAAGYTALPIERTGGGVAPSYTRLDAAVDSGVLTVSRAAWGRYVALDPEARRAVSWLAQRARAEVRRAEWLREYGEAYGPRPAATEAKRLSTEIERLALQVAALGRKRSGPPQLDQAQARERARAAHRQAFADWQVAAAELMDWAIAEFRRAHDLWFAGA